MHVDDFIGAHDTDPYASFVLNYFRHSAVLHMKLAPFMRGHHLYCTHEGKRYRVTGASRLGDVWLARDFKRDLGYEHRVDVAECSAWGAKP